jgi:hypothetical protein
LWSDDDGHEVRMKESRHPQRGPPESTRLIQLRYGLQ